MAGAVLATIPSSSNPGKLYEIRQPAVGGDPYCSCWAWKKNRTCKHLQAYQEGLKINDTSLGSIINSEVAKLGGK